MSTRFKTTKLFTIAFFSYLIITVILAAILISLWLPGQDIQGLNQVQLQVLAGSSSTIQFCSALIGSATALIISMVLAHKTRHINNSAIIGFTILLTCYSVLSIWLHPEHNLVYQLIKPILPAMVCFLGYCLVIKRDSN